MGVVVLLPTANAIRREMGRNHVHGWANVIKKNINLVVWSRMKQNEAESHRSETSPLNERKDFDERDTQLLLCHSWPLPLLLVVLMRGKPALFYHTRYIWKFCYNATLCGRHLSNKMQNILKHLWCFHVFYQTKPDIEGVWRHWQATQWHYGHGPFN